MASQSLNRPINLLVEDELILREIHLRDVDAIFNIIDAERESLKEWLPFVVYTRHSGDTMSFIRSLSEGPIDRRDLVFTIQDKGKIIGLISLKGTDWTNQKTEIGYWLSVKYQGKGIVTKSCKRLIHFAFDALKLNRIQIKAATLNYKSQQIPKRLGFTFEGTERAGELLLTGFTDLAIYSLLKKEFLDTV
ncbi:MAG: GNAT family N-acetyltransferase [Bacteroidetes bacterium]|nr:GNAT family N-acetyltransferase [Bacteroidota bacterium]